MQPKSSSATYGGLNNTNKNKMPFLDPPLPRPPPARPDTDRYERLPLQQLLRCPGGGRGMLLVSSSSRCPRPSRRRLCPGGARALLQVVRPAVRVGHRRRVAERLVLVAGGGGRLLRDGNNPTKLLSAYRRDESVCRAGWGVVESLWCLCGCPTNIASVSLVTGCSKRFFFFAIATAAVAH